LEKYWLIFTVQKKYVIIEEKKSVAWGQCAEVVGSRRAALLVGHRGRAAAGGNGARGGGIRLEHLQTQQHYFGRRPAPLNTKVVRVHGVVRGGGGKAVLG